MDYSFSKGVSSSSSKNSLSVSKEKLDYFFPELLAIDHTTVNCVPSSSKSLKRRWHQIQQQPENAEL